MILFCPNNICWFGPGVIQEKTIKTETKLRFWFIIVLKLTNVTRQKLVRHCHLVVLRILHPTGDWTQEFKLMGSMLKTGHYSE